MNINGNGELVFDRVEDELVWVKNEIIDIRNENKMLKLTNEQLNDDKSRLIKEINELKGVEEVKPIDETRYTLTYVIMRNGAEEENILKGLTKIGYEELYTYNGDNWLRWSVETEGEEK